MVSGAKVRRRRLELESSRGKLPVEFLEPPEFTKAVIVANGAGANMESDFIRYFHGGLAESGLLSVRFNFPYQARGRRAPDPPGVLDEAYLSVVEAVAKRLDDGVKGIVAGGKSMGGRIASRIAERAGLRRLFFLGYPLHPAGKRDRMRDAHLYEISARMLFISGTRDPLCDLTLLSGVLDRLPRARLVTVEGGDHSLRVSGSTRRPAGRKQRGHEGDHASEPDPNQQILTRVLGEIVRFARR